MTWEEKRLFKIRQSQAGKGRGAVGILKRELLDSKPQTQTTWQLYCNTYGPTDNPGQNYLRKFTPSCPLSYATKLFRKRRLCRKKTPSPNSMLLPTNAQGSCFFLNTQRHCFQGKGEREEPVQLRCLEKCCPSIQFSQQFCPRLCIRWFTFSCKNICKDKTKTC